VIAFRPRLPGKVVALAGVAAATFVLGCVSAVPRVDASLVSAARGAAIEADVQLLEQGYGAYRTRCAGCHQLVAPADRTFEDWPVVVEGHRQRLGLSDAEVEAITAYLQAGRVLHLER
jgi:mono/diheme cytochrome c family protein